MSNKVEKPTLSGTRLKTRKRDEKEKYDPNSFRDALIQGLNETQGSPEKISKFLDVSGSRLNYRRYADVLFDVLFAGGILAPGGRIVESSVKDKPSTTDVCLFQCEDTPDSIRQFYEVFYKLIRRYKYLEKSFQEEVRKVLVFQRGFSVDERRRLAEVTAHILANYLATPKVLEALLEEHLVKDGVSLECASQVFAGWLRERDMREVFSALKKVQMDTRLEELFPANKRLSQTMGAYWREQGLGAIADMQASALASKAKREAQKTLAELIKDQRPMAEMMEYAQDLINKQGMTNTEVTITIWMTVMAGVEWNKKDDLVSEQAMKQLAPFTPLLAAVATGNKTQLALMLRAQDFCYDHMALINTFAKIIIMLYKKDVLDEQVILHWHRHAHGAKGKTVFLQQLQAFVDWLQSAEEESDEDEE